jgi:hypothetical protein
MRLFAARLSSLHFTHFILRVKVGLSRESAPSISRATFITPPTKVAGISVHITEMRILNPPHIRGSDPQLLYRSCRYHLISPPQPLRHLTYFFKSNKGHAAK